MATKQNISKRKPTPALASARDVETMFGDLMGRLERMWASETRQPRSEIDSESPQRGAATLPDLPAATEFVQEPDRPYFCARWTGGLRFALAPHQCEQIEIALHGAHAIARALIVDAERTDDDSEPAPSLSPNIVGGMRYALLALIERAQHHIAIEGDRRERGDV